MVNSKVRNLLSSSVAVLAAVTVMTGVLAPAVATAAPAGTSASAAQTPEELRTNAAAVVGLTITPDLLRISERDFVYAIYQAAKQQGDIAREVQFEALDAYNSGRTSSFLSTWIYEAHQRDLDREAVYQVRRGERQPAATLLGFELTTILLAQDDKNFVFALWERAAKGSFVKAAAGTVYSGTPVEHKEFILRGIFVEHQRDLDAAKEAAEKEAAEKKLREARVKAGAVVGMDPALAAYLTDEYFVEQIWTGGLAPQDSEVWYQAYLSRTPEQWRAFIDTGIFEAAAKDKVNAIKVRAAAVVGIDAGYAKYLQEDALIREIRNRARSGSQVQAAAYRALQSGSPAQWRTFLETDIFTAAAADKP
ncbi:ALF repeat-containing protein [Amycolatopsis pittospori]|uniref:ALF repeat-containing protein n=1 Tax=Amycolatopsis pittospori TaxID=2749434 RepID=UPI001F4254E6|nr:ALF repeat-containing protein [Amycolatopsis pittospori]